MSVYDSVANRQTDDVIVITFRNWTEYVLYDSRKTDRDIPIVYDDYPAQSVYIDGNLTIIEM